MPTGSSRCRYRHRTDQILTAAFEAAITEAAHGGDPMMDLARRLFPLCRSLTGAGVRQTLDILAERMPLERHRAASGTRCFAWTVPPEWNVRDAYVNGPSGERVIDFRANNLHLVSYSIPIRTRLSLAELRPHLHSLPDQPDAIPYRTSYYAEAWGFCLSDRQKRGLVEGTYKVVIDVTLAPGHLDYASAEIGGDGDLVLFSTYICHPSMANNELSGPILLAQLYRALPGIPGLRHRYRFLFIPETIGSILYLSLHGDDLRRSLHSGYVVTCAGDAGPYTYKRSRRGTASVDRIALHALRHTVERERLNVVDFDPASGSDERQYCSPGFDLPVGSVIRSMYGRYPEYHTSLDDLSFISAEGLSGTLTALLRIVEAGELNRSYVRADPHCEPQLGRRGLYPSLGASKVADAQVRRLMYLLNYSDGAHDLIAIAERLDEPVWALAGALEDLLRADLLRPSPQDRPVSPR